MAEQPSNNQGDTRDTRSVGQELLDKALTQEPVKPDCRHQYGLHQWIKHEETLMEFCSVCKIRKDVWEDAKGGNTGDVTPVTPKEDESASNNAEKSLEKVPEHLREHVFKEGNKMGKGRPPGSKNLTTLFREALRNKEYTLKDEATGQTLKIKAENALVEKALENAIKKGDRESIRMIWEMLDGKPTQQHRLEVNGPKGYEIDPEREAIYLDQFDVAVGVTVKATKTVRTEVQTLEVTQEPPQPPNATPEASQPPKTGQ